MLNLVALVGVQGGNALIPLLIVPFALAMTGAVAYAQIAITEAISAVVLATVLFSFEVDGVARVAGLRPAEHIEKLSEALSDIISARLVLFAASSVIVLAAYSLVPGAHVGLLALWLLVPFGHVFHSYWLYQGIERNVTPAVLTLLSRVATVGIILLCVRSSADRYWVPVAIGAPFAIGALMSTAYQVAVLKLRPRWVGIRRVMAQLGHGKEIFGGTAAVMLYREVNVLILGIVGTPASGIATYAFIEKSVKMLQACSRPLSQFYFPKVLRAISGEREPTLAVARIIARFTIIQLILVSILLTIIPILYFSIRPMWPAIGRFTELPQVIIITVIMAPATLFGMMNFMFGIVGLNYLGERRYFLRAILITGASSVVSCFALTIFSGAIGAAICFTGAELMLLSIVLIRYFCGRQSSYAGLS